MLEASTHDTIGRQPGEDPKRRVDRELGEMLEEIRVALPGVELLLGFLLILPFSDRFGALDEVQRGLYLACLITTAAASVLFIAPTAQHRLGFRTVDKEQLLISGTRQIIAGLVMVAVAILSAVTLVVWVVVDSLWAQVIAIPLALWFMFWWFLVPFRRRTNR